MTNNLTAVAQTPADSPQKLSTLLEEAVIDYFRIFHPRFVNRNLRRMLLGYIEFILETGIPHHEKELASFMYQLDEFFNLLEIADRETADWPQLNRVGYADKQTNV